jgi:hypothetical protein
MQIDCHALPRKFSDVPSGTFFKVLRRVSFFAFAVTDVDNRAAALAFAVSPNRADLPRLVEQGFQQDTIAAFPMARIKLDWLSASRFDGDAPLGAIITTTKGYYIRAATGNGYSMTFDLASGAVVTLSDSEAPMIAYNKWQVGHGEGEKFDSIFEFSLPT